MHGWFLITLLVFWIIGTIANLGYVAVHKHMAPATGADCFIGALIAGSIALGVVFLTPGTLTVFGTLLVAWYLMWFGIDLIHAFKGSFVYPSWWHIFGVILG